MSNVEPSLRMSFFSKRGSGEDLNSVNREIWRLAWPAFVGQGINSAIILITRSIMAVLGNEVFNGVSIGMMIFFVIVTVLAAVGVGVTALVAQAVGAGDRERAGKILQQSLMLAGLLAFIISLIGVPLSHYLFHLLVPTPAVAEPGERFTTVLLIFLVPLSFGFIFASALRGAGDTKTPMICGVILGALALALNVLLIKGLWGFPKMGLNGVIISMVAAFFSNTLIMGLLFLFKKTVLELPMRGWRVDLKIWKDVLYIGGPSALEWTLIQVGLLIYVGIVNRYGVDQAAGYFIGGPILALIQTPMFGFQTAATTMVGQAVGAKDFKRAETAFRQNLRLTVYSMIVLGIILYFTCEPLIDFFFSDSGPEARLYAVMFSHLVVFAMPVMALGFTISGGLRGAGDTIPPLISQAVGMFMGRLAFATPVYHFFHPPLIIIWMSMFPDFIIRDVLLIYRLISGKWKTVSKKFVSKAEAQEEVEFEAVNIE